MHRTSDDALVFMVKWPEPGRTKTRLCPPLSPAEAAALARAFLLDTLAEAEGAGMDRLLAFAPASAACAFRQLAGPGTGLIEAECADLGAALAHAQQSALAAGYRRVALVGADLPHLDRARYAEALDTLACADVAIGPSGDGGYYLLAASRETPALFNGVAWSTPSVLGETLASGCAAGLSIVTVAPCDDVDTASDLVWLLAELRGRPGAGHTLALLEPLVARLDGSIPREESRAP
jgi:uncharacterized protein